MLPSAPASRLELAILSSCSLGPLPLPTLSLHLTSSDWTSLEVDSIPLSSILRLLVGCLPLLISSHCLHSITIYPLLSLAFPDRYSCSLPTNPPAFIYLDSSISQLSSLAVLPLIRLSFCASLDLSVHRCATPGNRDTRSIVILSSYNCSPSGYQKAFCFFYHLNSPLCPPQWATSQDIFLPQSGHRSSFHPPIPCTRQRSDEHSLSNDSLQDIL